VRLTPGTRVGPYEVVALLGAGGMAEVYRAKDTRLGREVAIKVVSEALGGDGAFLERFDREAKLAASLAHPNVVALFDVGLQDGKPYFVTELLQGETLRERSVKGTIQLATALEWAAQMAQGLAAAHERGIVHRDLKPENVFITRDGHVKLLDFGIAKLVEAVQAATPHGLMDDTVSPSGSHTRTGVVVGTPGYMSPEQVRGDSVDARTDFFSLGAVLYEMLCGRRAFPAGPVVESGYAILHNEPEPLPASVPPLVMQVVQRCLEKEPGRRFQSARDLAFNLELVRAPTVSGVTARDLAGQRSFSRNWRLLLAISLATLGVAAAMYFLGRGARPGPPAVESLVSGLGRVSAGRFNPDGRVIFSAAWEGQPLQIYAQSPGSLEAQALGLRDMALLAVSPTGELAVLVRPESIYGIPRGTLAVVPGVGGTPREVAENVLRADWSPTGELAVVRSVGGREQLEYPIGKVLLDDSNLLLNPRVSPNGDVVALFSGNQLKLVDRKGQTRTLTSKVHGAQVAWAPNGEEVWFTNYRGAAVWAANARTGETRLVYQGLFEMALEDISKDGRVLVNAMERRWEITFAPSGNLSQVRLSSGSLMELSDDGGQVLSGSRTGASLGPTDGGPPLKLGTGAALALSPDAKWVLAQDNDSTDLTLLSVGPERPRTLATGMTVAAARFFHDGHHIVFTGQRAGEKQLHLYAMSLDGGTPVALSQAGIPWMERILVSRDGRFVAVRAADEVLTLYPTDGGPAVPLSELGKDVQAVAWNPEGHLWVRPQFQRELPSRILLYDFTRRRMLQDRRFSLNDSAGVLAVSNAASTPDARAIAFEYERVLGHLFLLDGLGAPRR